MTNFKISKADRKNLLKGFNELRSALQTMEETQDVWLSDIRNMELLRMNLSLILNFSPKQDDEGERLYYADWVLDEEKSK
jgi:hypothetical protein